MSTFVRSARSLRDCSPSRRSRRWLRGGADRRASTKPFAPARLWDGKTPDFRGIWQVRDTAYVNIEGHPAEKGIAAVEEHHRRSARWEDSVQTGGARAAAEQLSEIGRLPIRRSSAIRPVFRARRIFRLRCRFFRAPATLRSSTRRITPFASSIRTLGRTSTAQTGGWATRVTDGTETRWLPTSSR